MDYTAITGAVDFAGVMTGISAVAVSLAGLYIAIRGGRILLSFLRG